MPVLSHIDTGFNITAGAGEQVFINSDEPFDIIVSITAGGLNPLKASLKDPAGNVLASVIIDGSSNPTKVLVASNASTLTITNLSNNNSGGNYIADIWT